MSNQTQNRVRTGWCYLKSLHMCLSASVSVYMLVCACICVSVCNYAHLCGHLCMSVCVCLFVSVRICVSMTVFACVHLCVSMYICGCVVCAYVSRCAQRSKEAGSVLFKCPCLLVLKQGLSLNQELTIGFQIGWQATSPKNPVCLSFPPVIPEALGLKACMVMLGILLGC